MTLSPKVKHGLYIAGGLIVAYVLYRIVFTGSSSSPADNSAPGVASGYDPYATSSGQGYANTGSTIAPGITGPTDTGTSATGNDSMAQLLALLLGNAANTANNGTNTANPPKGNPASPGTGPVSLEQQLAAQGYDTWAGQIHDGGQTTIQVDAGGKILPASKSGADLIGAFSVDRAGKALARWVAPVIDHNYGAVVDYQPVGTAFGDPYAPNPVSTQQSARVDPVSQGNSAPGRAGLAPRGGVSPIDTTVINNRSPGVRVN